mmetsp:Transcript_41950/g.125486  ORF Transcript_41950/g.125486 Transcript_41950/m.125486 type:complete len:345 (+) Transcript_41950:749-1783(+)
MAGCRALDIHGGRHQHLLRRGDPATQQAAGPVDRPVLQHEDHDVVVLVAGELDHRWLVGEERREKLRRQVLSFACPRFVPDTRRPGGPHLSGLGEPEIAISGREDLRGRVVRWERAGHHTLQERRRENSAGMVGALGRLHAGPAAVPPDLVALGVDEVERSPCRERVPQRDWRPRRPRWRGHRAGVAVRQVHPRDFDGGQVGAIAGEEDRVLAAGVRGQVREGDVQVAGVGLGRDRALLDLRVLVRLTVRRDEALEPLRDAPGELALLLLRLVCGLQIRVRLGRALPAAVEVVARDLFGRCPAAGGGLDVAQQGVALLPLALQPAQVTDLVVARALGVLAFLLL